MKKTLLLMFAFLGGIMAQAQSTATYTDDLVVTINEESTEPQKTDIKVTTNADGTYTLMLDNFMLSAWNEEEQKYDVLPVGSIVVENIVGETKGNIVSLSANRTIEIQPGTDESVAPDDWFGLQLNALGGVPIVLTADMTANKLYCQIEIDMTAVLNQSINVVFGSPIGETEEGTTVTYTDNLVVTINEESTDPQKTEIKVTTNADGTYTLMLDNFMLSAWNEEEQKYDVLPVGSIVVDNITGESKGDIVFLSADRTIEIQPGTDESVAPDDWFGLQLNALGGVPIVLTADMTADKLYCQIDIDMTAVLNQSINVVFGTPFNGTGIRNIGVGQVKSDGYYSLNGVLMGTDWNKLSKGIYIINGKKVIK
ncbi:MAG: calycin-like domain-containing protein [Paraprevotella sp.]|nr:calycin-like domain-containing protein [Paraprevotella sp.]MBP3471247.1 calycin-like domain-containing protein [Paraprevotella sp.]